MRKWLALGAVVGVIFGAVVVTCPARRRRPKWRRWLLLWVLAQLRIDWDPLSWLSSIGHIASSSVQSIENWARNAINAALTIYDDSLQWVFDGIDDAINAAGNVLSIVGNYAVDALDWINNAPNTIGGWIESAWDRFWNDVVAPAINAVTGFAQDVYNWAVDAYNALDSAYDWVVANVIDPVVRWIESADQWWENHLAQWWDDIWSSTIGPMWSWIQWVVDNLPGWVDWLANTAFDAVELVVQAGDWIVWFAEHSFDDLESMGASLEDMFTPGWIQAAAAGESDLAAGIEDDFVKIMGG